MAGLRIVSFTSGMGDAGGDTLLARVQRLVGALNPASYDASMKVGYAGDIPNAAAEKESVVSEAAWASGMAFVLILAGRLVVLPLRVVARGHRAAGGARRRLGLRVRVLPLRVREHDRDVPRRDHPRQRHQLPDRAALAVPGVPGARDGAGHGAARGGAERASRGARRRGCVAAIAYGSLTFTDFRGFNQFGWIGLFGMLLVWLSMIPCVPALIVVIEWIQARLPRWLRDPEPSVRPDGSKGPVSRLVARLTERAPWVLVGAAVAVTALAAWKVPAFLRDPWEYNFDRLGSRGSKRGGAGEWSNKAERVFGGKMNVAGALMLADTAEQVPLVKARILANDAADPQGKLIAEVATVWDLLPGTVEAQQSKLELLERIRDRLTPAVLHDLPDDERARVEELRPPERLRVLGPTDLPALLRRRFAENDGRVGTVFYVKYGNDVSLSDGHNLLRLAKATDNVVLADGTVVQTASRSTVFAEMIRSMERDGPRATFLSFAAVTLVVLVATRNVRGALAVLAALLLGVTWLVGGAAWLGEKLNYVNFITLPITFGIGCEYPFNVYDRSRLLAGDVTAAVRRVGGAVALCSFTTMVGYGSLLFADFQALQSFGRLAVSGEIACLTAALLVLPSLLHVIGRRRAFAAESVGTKVV